MTGPGISRVKRRERARRRRRILVGLLLLSAAVPAARYRATLVSATGRFFHAPVRRVVSSDQDLDFSHLLGRNMLTLVASEIAERAGLDPAIASVAARKSWPDTIVVTIFRRAPYAVLLLDGRERVVVDRTGMPTGLLPEKDPSDRLLLEISGLDGEKAALTVPEVADLVEDFRFAGPGSVSVRDNYFVIVQEDGREILVPRNGSRKAAGTARSILADFERKGVRYKYLDLRFAEPVFLPEETAPAGRRHAR